MIFVTLYKFRRRLTKADIENANKVFAGVKVHGLWWTLGRFDAVRVFEAKDEKEAMGLNIQLEGTSTETLVAVERNEAVKKFIR